MRCSGLRPENSVCKKEQFACLILERLHFSRNKLGCYLQAQDTQIAKSLRDIKGILYTIPFCTLGNFRTNG
jgi:hypothetical protein